MVAALHNQTTNLKTLLEKGANPLFGYDDMGKNALVWAKSHNRRESVQLMEEFISEAENEFKKKNDLQVLSKEQKEHAVEEYCEQKRLAAMVKVTGWERRRCFVMFLVQHGYLRSELLSDKTSCQNFACDSCDRLFDVEDMDRYICSFL